jgi:putative ABC transport system permease protein
MNENRPPHFVLRLLRWFCPEQLYEEIEGDLIQNYKMDLARVGEGRARLRLFWNAIRFFRPGILMRNKVSAGINQSDMLRNHLKLAIRIFFKDKLFSTLNVLGLALGIGVSIILLLILQNDLTFDEHYAHHERMYRLGAHYQIPGTDINIGKTARELGPILKDQYPEIEALARVETFDHSLVKYDKGNEEVMFYEEGVAQTESSYFNVFEHQLIAGDKTSCLSDAGNVLITSSVAKKYFGDDDPLNQILWINSKSRKVTGVMSDFPENTHLKFDFLLSGLPETREDWDGTMKDGKPIPLVFWNPDVYTYLLIPERYNVNAFYSRFGFIYDRYFKDPELDGKSTPILQPLSSIHFSGFQDDGPHGNMTYLLTFVGIGLMIMLLACINYMNLSTAKAVSRATEIAVKKISGSHRSTLFISFLVESLFLSFISLALAIILVFAVLDLTSFNQLIGKNLSLDFTNSALLIGAPAIALAIGIVSGLYPAVYLPTIPAISALKGTFKNRGSSQVLRKVLITVQFSISIFVVLCTLFMQSQID